MAMTLATLRTLVRQLVGDPQGSTYSPEMCQDAINFACKEYAKKTGATYVETSVTMDTYTGLCTIPTPYMRINRVMVGGVLSYGIYKIDDGGAKTSVPIGTSASGTTPDDASRYLIRGNCVLFPSATARASINRGLVAVYESDGTVSSHLDPTEAFTIGTIAPNFNVQATESCYGLTSHGLLSGGQYMDFSLIGVCNGVSGEIKLRYIEPLP